MHKHRRWIHPNYKIALLNPARRQCDAILAGGTAPHESIFNYALPLPPRPFAPRSPVSRVSVSKALVCAIFFFLAAAFVAANLVSHCLVLYVGFLLSGVRVQGF